MGPQLDERQLNGMKEMDIVMMFIAGEGDIITHLVKPCKQCCVDVITHLGFVWRCFLFLKSKSLTDMTLFFFFFHENRWLSHILLESLRAKLLPFLVFTKTRVKF